ncbi:MAG TPA: hypothetical protein DDW52_25790 [Planctomycetaceae bacterium]|nr:hypothetical protein [Planctomycetaceae bacterium]
MQNSTLLETAGQLKTRQVGDDQNAIAYPETLEFGGQPHFKVARFPSGDIELRATLRQLGLVDAMMVYLPASATPVDAFELLAESMTRNLVVCGAEEVGQAWLPTALDQRDALEETQAGVRITRAFSLPAGLYAAGALAKASGSLGSALVLLPPDWTLSDIGPEIYAVLKVL